MADIATIEEAVTEIAAGRMVILVDDEDRENEGDLVVAAECVTPEHINFMAREARGLICLTLVPERVDALGLAPMARQNTAPLGTAFTNSIDHATEGGLGARGRAHTIRAAVAADARAEDFTVPGHVFPLRARRGGVLVRSGQTEGSVDLARLAGLAPAGVICEVINPDGTMSRLPRLLDFGQQYDMPVVTVADLIRYRLSHEPLVRCVSRAKLPTAYGVFDLHCFENSLTSDVHVALSIGDISGAPTLVRVHRADALGDVFGLDIDPSRSRLAWCLRRMASVGRGVLLYLRADGTGSELGSSVQRFGAMARRERIEPAFSTSMGFHDFGIGAQILRAVGLKEIRVLTNSPMVFKGLSGFDLEIVEWVPIRGEPEVDA